MHTKRILLTLLFVSRKSFIQFSTKRSYNLEIESAIKFQKCLYSEKEKKRFKNKTLVIKTVVIKTDIK